jgi:hypothetical protein
MKILHYGVVNGATGSCYELSVDDDLVILIIAFTPRG